MHAAVMQKHTPHDWSAQTYAKIEQAIAYIEAHYREQPGLEEIAQAVGLSAFHFQRLFSQWAGISPKRFLQHVTLEQAKALLDKRQSVLDATLETGLSSPSRLHDLFVTCEAVTPGDYKSGGKGVEIAWGVHDTPFGPALFAVTARGLCVLDFLTGGAENSLTGLRKKWPNAALRRDEAKTAPLVEAVFQPGAGFPRLALHLRGSNFQLRVWQALLRIPSGALVTYEDVARAAGNAKAVRAAGSAVGDNPIAYLVPCHRVLRKGGGIGGYATGTPRKRAMLGLELAAGQPEE